MRTPPNLILFAPWFGPWPVWINLYLESCRWNPNITWLIHTDQTPPENRPPNVIFEQMPLQDFVARIQDVTGVRLKVEMAYKITDFKPLLGAAFEDDILGYSHFGYTDLDIIYGQLDCELTVERLTEYEAISSHANLQAGHLSVYQNTPRMRMAWRRMPKWRRILKKAKPGGFDEQGFGRHLNPAKWHPPWRRYKALWHEMYSMPDRGRIWLDGGPTPTRMSWYSGRLTEPRHAKPQYAYLHFMLWRSNKYRRVDRSGPAPWTTRDKIMHIDWRDAAEHGFAITHQGFVPRDADGEDQTS